MKLYEVDIYGRNNSIILSIKGKLIDRVQLYAETKKEAKEKAWLRFSEVEKNMLIKRTDVKIECEEVTW